LLTKRRQAKALGAFASAVNAAINADGGYTTVRTTQPTTQMAIVVTEQNLGVCYCVTDALANPYPFNPSGGGCGCGMGPS
jgi:hypothetical protein